MATDMGAGYMELVRRGFYAPRSGELQLVVWPYNSANYPPESRSLVPDDPRSSHAAPWLYLERVPLVAYGPGRIMPGAFDERVTLADLAPTTAGMIGASGFEAPDGHVLPGISQSAATRPKVVVTFVIDGGGWNTLTEWPDRWPNLKGLMAQGANYRNAIMGSFPAVTACAHTTIGTGAFPATHGVSGHFIRSPDDRVEKAYGEDGEADTSVIEEPTLAEYYAELTGGQSWVGEIGYQIWHLGMMGNPGVSYPNTKPVGVYFDEDRTGEFQSQNPERYRLPQLVPRKELLDSMVGAYQGPEEGSEFTPKNASAVCCSPPVVIYQGDLIEATLNVEPIGETDATSLLYINYKAPDYAGHIYNMLAEQEAIALEAVDAQLGRLVQTLERRWPGEYVLFVTADHGQCPLVNEVGGVRLDPIQLQADINAAFGAPHGVQLVKDPPQSSGAISQSSIRPAEVYLEPAAAVKISGDVSQEEMAAAFRHYTYADNFYRYKGVPADAIQWGEMHHREFAAVFAADYLRGLTPGKAATYGSGIFQDADTQIVDEARYSP